MKTGAGLLTKITRPVLPDVVTRERLFRLIDERRYHPLLWVQGPGGSGKTTLVASYLDSRKLPCLWYQADRSDADIAGFFHYMGAAAQQVSAKKNRPLPALTAEYLQGLDVFSKKYFSELFGRLKPPFAIVFDNYQDAPPASQLHEIISSAVALVPEGISIFIISRKEPVSDFMATGTDGRMSVIEWDDIRFTMQELKDFAGRTGQVDGGKDVPDTVLRQIHAKTEGWAAGFILMLERAKAGSIAPELFTSLPSREIFEYFAGEIFERADPETQDFLLKTSFFPKISADAAEKLTGYDRAEQKLFNLVRSNFFTERHSKTAHVYQYHPLFREFLLERAAATYSPEELNLVRRTAASLLAESGQAGDAAGLLIDSGDWEGLSALVLRQAEQLMAEGRSRTLQEWLRAIPENVMSGNPNLLLWLGICTLSFNPAEARGYFEKSMALFRSNRDVSGLFLSWSSIVDTYPYEQYDWKPLDKWLSVFNEFMAEGILFPSEAIESRASSSMFVSLVLRPEDQSMVYEWADRVLANARRDHNIAMRLNATFFLTIYNMWVGEYRKNEILIRNMEKEILSPDAPPLAIITIRMMEAMHAWLNADHGRCMKAVLKAQEVAGESGVRIWDNLLTSCAAEAAMVAGDLASVREILGDLAANLKHATTLDCIYYYLLSAWVSILEGDISIASVHLKDATVPVERLGSRFHEGIWNLGMAYGSFMNQDMQRALMHADRAYDISRFMKSHILEYASLLGKAFILIKTGQEDAGMALLQQGMKIGREYDYLHFLWWQPSVMAELCAKALEAGIETAYVQKLITKRNLALDPPPVHLKTWPWYLKISTLGRFEMARDGEPVTFSGKVQQRPLSMLKAVIAFGGKGVDQQQLMDALWPEAEGDAAQRSFDTTLYRLRKMIGNDSVVRLADRRLTLDGRHCWLDTWAFERQMCEAETVWHNGNDNNGSKKEALSLTVKALGLYSGHFLESETDVPWAALTRERLMHKFLRGTVRACRYWEEEQDYERALEFYHRGLEADDLCEEFYQGLMLCHGQLGQKAEAVKVYYRCSAALSERLGISPSRKTEELFKAIRTGG